MNQDKIEKEEQFCSFECKNFSESGSLGDIEVQAQNILNTSIQEEEEEDEALLELLINFSKDGKNAQAEIQKAKKEDQKKEQSSSSVPSHPNDSQRKKQDKDQSDGRQFHDQDFLARKYKEQFFGLTKQVDDNIHDILFLEGLKFYLTFIHVLNPTKTIQDPNMNLDSHITLLSFLSGLQEEQKKSEHERTLIKVLQKSKQILFGLDISDENELMRQVFLQINQEICRLDSFNEVIKFQKKIQKFDSQKLTALPSIPIEILKLIFNNSLVINNWSVINGLMQEFLDIKKLNQIQVDQDSAKAKKFVDINVVCTDLECQIVGKSKQNSKQQSSKQSSIIRKDMSLSGSSLKNQLAQSLPKFELRHAVPIFDYECTAFYQSVLGSRDEFKTFSEMFSKCKKDCDHKVNKGHSEIALACFMKFNSKDICRAIASKLKFDCKDSLRQIERVEFRLPLYSTRDTCINCDYSLSHPWTEIQDQLLEQLLNVFPFENWPLKDPGELYGIQKAMTFTLENPEIKKIEPVEHQKSFSNFNFRCDRNNPRGFFKANFLIKVLTDLNDAKVEKLALKNLKSLAKKAIQRDQNLKIFSKEYHTFLDSVPLLTQKQNLKYISPSRTFFLNYSLQTNADEIMTHYYKKIAQRINHRNEQRRNRAASLIKLGFFKYRLRCIFEELRVNQETLLEFERVYQKSREATHLVKNSKLSRWISVQGNRNYLRAIKVLHGISLKKQHPGLQANNNNLYVQLCYLLTKLFFLEFSFVFKIFLQSRTNEKKSKQLRSWKPSRVNYVFYLLYEYRANKIYQLISGKDLKVPLTKEKKEEEDVAVEEDGNEMYEDWEEDKLYRKVPSAEIFFYEKWLGQMKKL